MQNDCYTPTEFALFGIGICIAGILIGVVVLAYVKNKCSAEDKLYEYTLDDTRQVSTKKPYLSSKIAFTLHDLYMG